MYTCYVVVFKIFLIKILLSTDCIGFCMFSANLPCRVIVLCSLPIYSTCQGRPLLVRLLCAEVIPVIGGLKSLYHSTCTDNHQTTSSNTNTRPLLLK